jgi:phosphoglycolate phosphatase
MRRLVLFDIDGTLLTSQGAGKRAVREALLEVFGETGPIGEYSFAGRTDPQIVHDLLSAAGLTEAQIMAGQPDMWRRYLEKLREDLPGARVQPCPGVHPLLDRLEEAGGETLLGLLTGNLEEGARLKLEAGGIAFERFRLGAYGSDHRARPELPAIAIERARRLTGLTYQGKEVVVIGDTPFDIDCGRHLGVRTLAVATGQHSSAELAEHAPDFLMEDLSDVEAAWRAIME